MEDHCCGICRWLKVIEDSAGRYIDICVMCESPCYLEETGYLGTCDEWESEWEEEDYGL